VIFIDRISASDNILQTTITNNTETIAFTDKTFRQSLYKARFAESSGILGLEVKVANSVHCKYFGKATNIPVKDCSVLFLVLYTTVMTRVKPQNIEINQFVFPTID
jgi:hypothetical protein